MSTSKPAAKLLSIALSACAVVIAVWLLSFAYRAVSGGHDLDDQLGRQVTVRYLTEGPAGTDHVSGELIKIDKDWITIRQLTIQPTQMESKRLRPGTDRTTTTWIPKERVISVEMTR